MVSYRVKKLAFAYATAVILHHFSRRSRRPSQRQAIHAGGPEAAERTAMKLLDAPNRVFFDLFRMNKATFNKLVRWLVNAGLEGSRYETVEQKVLIFLYICAHNSSQRQTADRFKVAQSSVSATFQKVLKVMVKLFQAFVRLPEEDYVSKEIELSEKRSEFNGCIGAIDGTLVRAHIPRKHHINWRSRKGKIHQNVFVAVRMDGTFSYVLAGAEGSVNDSTLLNYALSKGFSIPPHRFYLADAGFGGQAGIVQPYYGIRYHLQEWREGGRGPENREELYNLRQSGSRMIVEQVIGIVKRKWKILRETAPEYGLRTQMRIVYAVCGLHNFIRRAGEEEVDEEAGLTDGERRRLQRARQRCERLRNMPPLAIRSKIARDSWRAYSRERLRRRAG